MLHNLVFLNRNFSNYLVLESVIIETIHNTWNWNTINLFKLRFLDLVLIISIFFTFMPFVLCSSCLAALSLHPAIYALIVLGYPLEVSWRWRRQWAKPIRGQQVSTVREREREREREGQGDGSAGHLLHVANHHKLPLPCHYCFNFPLLTNQLCFSWKLSGWSACSRLGAQEIFSAFMHALLCSNSCIFKESPRRSWKHQFNGRVVERTWKGSGGKFEKRAWNSQFSGGMGKRAWNSQFSGGMGKRAWNSQFSGGMGKRAWVRSFSGGLGK